VHTSHRGAVQNDGRDPRDTMAAQYSMPFCAGVAVAKNPRDPAAYAAANLRDPVVCELASRTTRPPTRALTPHGSTHYSVLIPVSLISWLILDISLFMRAPYSCGLLPTGSTPACIKRSLISGVLM
jgi:hypothetical protein